MLANSVGHLHQPGPVSAQLQDVGGGEELDPVKRRVAQRLKQPRGDQNGNVMRLAVQHPGRLLGRKANGQLPKQRQKPMLILFHARDRVEAKDLRRHGRLARRPLLLCLLNPLRNLLRRHLRRRIVAQLLHKA